MKRYQTILLISIVLLGCSSCRLQQTKNESHGKLFSFGQNTDRDFKMGLIDRTGKVVVEPQFDHVYAFSEGLAAVQIGGKCGYIDETGKLVINPQFNSSGNNLINKALGEGVYDFSGEGVFDFSEGLASVPFGDKWGYIDKQGKIVINPQFDLAHRFSDGFALVLRKTSAGDGYEIGFIDKSGKMVINLTGKTDGLVGSFSEGLAPVAFHVAYSPTGTFPSAKSSQPSQIEMKEKFGYIDKTGEVVIQPPFDKAEKFSEGFAAVQNGGKWGYIDKTGKAITEPQFERADPFSEGLACTEIGGVAGFIDNTGKFAINPQFVGCSIVNRSSFSEGLANVAIRTSGNKVKWGYIDKTGNFVIKPQFDWASPFSDGLAEAGAGNEGGYIDKTGNYVWKSQR